MHSTPSTDLYPLTRNSRFAQISTSPRKRGEVKRAHERVFALAGDARPELMRRSVSLEITRAQGRPGARCTRGLVCKAVQKDAHEHTGSAGASGLPCAVVLRLISCSPRRPGFV